MQSRSVNSGETYRIIAGSNAETTIRKSHGKNYANGHVFLKGISEGQNITVGYSIASKVWSNAYEKIPNFIKWCKLIGKKIVSDKEVKTNIGFDNLPIGIVVNTFPFPVHSATSRVSGNPEKFLAGDFALFLDLMTKNKKIDFKFTIIQPGVSKGTFSPKLSYILAATDDSIINSGYSPLIVIGS